MIPRRRICCITSGCLSMSEMVERVERAIENATSDMEGSPMPSHLARVAIEAMREPTAEMVKHVEKHPGLLGYGDDGFDWIWSTMIDAALK
jgi:hypothetical protein